MFSVFVALFFLILMGFLASDIGCLNGTGS
jgi:hypothetical protein